MWVPAETMSTIAAKLANPNAVHANMLRGSIAKPSLEQILHIYGVDAVAGAVAKWRSSAARLETLNLERNA